jgi:hypothetical protein
VARLERYSPTMPSPTVGPADRHLWQIAAARDIIILSGVASALWIAYWLGDVFVPVFLALILAHIINPFVTLMERRWGWPRPLPINKCWQDPPKEREIIKRVLRLPTVFSVKLEAQTLVTCATLKE